jgi:Nif-specific regulatory protein
MDSLKDKIEDMEREEIINALKECNCVMAKAARKLGITERMIGYKIKKYSIQKEEVVKDGKQRGSEEQAVSKKKNK